MQTRIKKTPWNLFIFAATLMNFSVNKVTAETILDDFSNGSVTDGIPIEWKVEGNEELSFSDAGLRLRITDGVAGVVSLVETNSTGWSMRVQARQEEGDITGLGTISNPVTWATINPDGLLVVGHSGETVLASAPTDFDPRVDDVILQLDTFDDELRAWAWLAGTVPESTEPLASASFSTLGNASAGFWVRDFFGTNGGLAQSTFKWAEISDQHIPIPVPEPSGWSLLIFVGPAILLFASRKTRKRRYEH